MTTDREKHGGQNAPSQKPRGPLTWLAARTWRFWVGLGLLLTLYVGSFGPVCWRDSRLSLDKSSGRGTSYEGGLEVIGAERALSH